VVTTDASNDNAAPILVVDDHAPNLLALEAVLECVKYPVVTARSGEEAIGKARAQDFVLVLMDVQMPGLDGYATVEQLRRLPRMREVPIVFLSAVFLDIEHARRGYALGAVDYITKPFDPDILRAKVRALISLYTRGQREERARRDELDRVKDVFLGAVGHDLRNPLNAVTTGASLLLQKTALSDDLVQRYALAIDRAARRMNRIIEDVLDLTRNKFAGGIPVELRPMDLADVCRGAVAEVQVANSDRTIEVSLGGNTTGLWDPARLGRVVSNLVGNAVGHSVDGPVRVAASGDEDGIVLTVHNGGPPIPDSVLAAVFEPFSRGDNNGGGLGRGLYIVREIVQAHGGTVEVQSTAVEGTTFTVRLPRGRS
jgi:signal transduction histidine kinase